MASSAKSPLRILGWLLVAVIVIALALLIGGDRLLIADDPPTKHADAAIVLQGSMVAEKARIAGAMNLLRAEKADRVLLSVPEQSYWGESIPPIARAYLERNYGNDLAARVDFCESSAEVNSTEEEAQALIPCIRDHQWRSIVIVTSSYHTRRAGMLWKRITKRDPSLQIWIQGVDDPEFQQPWWQHRQAAKIWVMEFTKLAWAVLG